MFMAAADVGDPCTMPFSTVMTLLTGADRVGVGAAVSVVVMGGGGGGGAPI